VKPLQQAKQSGFAGARWTDESNAFAALDADVEILDHGATTAVAKRNVFEDAGAAPDERLGCRVVMQVMRDKQSRKRFRKPRHMLRHVSERNREIARGMKH
jgi:hypothetical protein